MSTTLADVANDRGGHAIEWHLEQGRVWADLRCTNGPNAWCRTWCTAGCDERCTDPDEHPTGDTGSCFVTPYLDAYGANAEELYAGDKSSPRNGPIVLTWEGSDETYVWTYAPVDVAVADGAEHSEDQQMDGGAGRTFAELRNVCARAGLTGQDFETAFDAYIARGSLSAEDRATLAGQSSNERRSVMLSARYGSDGARVAEIAYRSRIGATR